MTKVKMTVSEAVVIFDELSSIQGKATIDMSWAIDDIKETLKKHKIRFTEEHKKLIEKYGKAVGNKVLGTQNYSVNAENVEAYKNEFEALSNIEVEVDIERLNFDAFAAQGLKVSPTASGVLRKIIVKATDNKSATDQKEKKSLK